MVDLKDQEKTTFTCPYRTFTFKRMSFGLCNAPTTFQRCMIVIFSDLIENIMEVFMDDFSVYGGSFDKCLDNLGVVLQRCREKKSGIELEEMSLHGIRGYHTWTSHFIQRNGSR